MKPCIAATRKSWSVPGFSIARLPRWLAALALAGWLAVLPGAATAVTPALFAWYMMDESNWGAVIDSSGNGRHGTVVGVGVTPTGYPHVTPPGSARSGDPGTCGSAAISAGTTARGVDAGFDMNSVGNVGSISFWYSSNTAWNDGTARMLLDASNDLGGGAADRNFFVVKDRTGRIRFSLEDSFNTGSTASTARNRFAANTWQHIAVTWNLTLDRVRIYLNGVLAATSTTNVNGTLGNVRSLYIGGRRGGTITGAPGYTTNSANGYIDEVRIYNTELTLPDVVADRGRTHPCPAVLHHLRILHDGEGLTCAPETVTIRACRDAGCNTLNTDTVTVTLAPAGWVGGDTFSFGGGQTTAQLRRTTPGTVTLGATATAPAAANPTRCFNGGTETCALTFVDAGFVIDAPDLIANRPAGPMTVRAVKLADDGISCAPAFSGARTVNFWSGYEDPNTGTMPVRLDGAAIAASAPGTGIVLTFDASATANIAAIHYADAGRMRLNARYEGSGAEAGLVMTGSALFVSRPVGIALLSPDANAECVSGDHTCSAFKKAGEAFNLTVRGVAWVADADTDLNDNPVTPNYRQNGLGIAHQLVAPAAGDAGSIGVTSADIAAGGSATLAQTVSEVGVFRFTATPPANGYFGHTVPAGTSANIGRFTPHHFATVVTPGCAGNFTYSGQPIPFRVQARNAAGGITRNYAGSFARPGVLSDANGNAGSFTPPSVTADRYVNGEADLQTTPEIAFAFANKFSAPATLRLRVDDGEASSAAGAAEGTTPLRSGRLVLSNAHGSDLLRLSMPIQARYWTGSAWATNLLDNCTDITGMLVTSPAPCVVPTGGTIAGGKGSLGFTAPNVKCRVDVCAHLAGDADHPVAACRGAVTGRPTWLQGDWDGAGGHDDNPAARASFGIHGGRQPIIYRRERY